METSDYLKLPKDTEHYWYNVLERTLRREVKEEVNAGGEIILAADESDAYAWVTLEEAKEYQLIDGIYDELVMVENKRMGRKTEWQRASV